MSIHVSSKSAEKNKKSSDTVHDEDSKVNTSAGYFNRSLYFKSVISDKDFSRFDFDDRKWMEDSKSHSKGSQNQSFENEPILPDKLETRMKTYMENDAIIKTSESSENELLGDSPEKKILEKGKEMVRKSGLGVDFSGKLISKEKIRSSIDQFILKTKFSTSLDLGVSGSNKFWLEQNSGSNDPIQVNRSGTFPHVKSIRFSKNSVKSSNLGSGESDIQGITSTKYSDLYCQDNLLNFKQKNIECVVSYPSFQIEQTQKNNRKKLIPIKNEDFVQISSQSLEEDREQQEKMQGKSEDLQQNFQNADKTNLKRIIAFEAKESTKMKRDTLEKSETDILENGSFLNMCGNDSLVIGTEHDKYSQMESFERY